MFLSKKFLSFFILGSSFGADQLGVSVVARAVAAPASEVAMDLTPAALDASWQKRHELCAKIIDLGTRKPEIPDNFEVAWRIGRFVYYGGFFCFPDNAEKSVKMDYFKYGVDALEKARKLNPSRVEGHYWYASVYGGYALAKGIRASLAGAAGMRDACTEAIKIDPSYHFGGPYRVRGRLYFALPSLISFGDNKLAYEDLKKAMELGPDNKLNSVYFSEVQAKVENKQAALKTAEKAKDIPDAVGVKEDASYRRDLDSLIKKWK